MRRARWTREDEHKLHWHWADLGCEGLAKMLDRTPRAVYRRARELGLFVGRSEWIDRRAAIEIIGLSQRYGKALLDATPRGSAGQGGVRRRLSERARREGHGTGHLRFHRADVVALAQRYWQERAQLVTMEEAARLTGAYAETVRRAFVRAGFPQPRRWASWRVPLDQAKAAVEAWRALPKAERARVRGQR